MSGAENPGSDELVAGKYRLTTLLGRGGMGSVWEGTHTSLGTRVAVKFIEAEYADSEEAKSRFRNEARAAATLRSKHVVQVYDHGVMDDGRPYIVMEFLAGEPLDRRLDRVSRLGLQDTAVIIGQVCRALAKAHEAGIVHRDLKPENVFLVWDDEDQADIVKVVDFGIAKFTDASVGVSSATRTGSVLGTPFYMSPEQARGLKSVDYRSDLWSVGVIAYRCVIGQLPFNGEAIGDLLVKICTAPLPVPSTVAPGVPPSFDAWFQKALAREPGDRFASAAELADALALACGVQGARSAMPSSVIASGGGAGVPALTPGLSTPGAAAYATPGYQSSGYGSQPGALTGAPTTQTPMGSRRSNKGALVAAGVGGLVVLAVAGVIVAKVAGSGPAPEPAPSAVAAAGPASAAPGPVVEPAPSASVAVAAPAPSAEPAPEQHPAEPVHVAKTATHVAKPKPAPAAPAPAPVPKPRPAPKPIDVGY